MVDEKMRRYLEAADELYSATAELKETADRLPLRLLQAMTVFAWASNEWTDHPLKRKE